MKPKAVIYACNESGSYSHARKKRILEKVVKILNEKYNCVLGGTETKDRDEYILNAQKLAKGAELFIIAGGDGAIHDIINIDDIVNNCEIGILPLGSGNGVARNIYDLSKFLLIPPHIIYRIAEQIRDGYDHKKDLILCNNKYKALFAGIGIDGEYFNYREELKSRGFKGTLSYFFSFFGTLFSNYERSRKEIILPEKRYNLSDVLQIIITKVPLIGYGFELIPEAKMDDGNIHLKYYRSHQIGNLITHFFKMIRNKNPPGYVNSDHIIINTEKELYLEVGGNVLEKTSKFEFKVLKGAITLKY